MGCISVKAVIMRSRLRGRLLFCLLAVPAVLAMAGCGGSATTSTPVPSASTASPVASVSGSPKPSQSPVGPAPSPATIDASKLTIIDEWRTSQVPQYPNSQRKDYQAEALSQVKNAGRMLFSTSDSPEQVIAFYRGALPMLGWKETSANEKNVSATHGDAGLGITVTGEGSGTQILMQLLDAPL